MGAHLYICRLGHKVFEAVGLGYHGGLQGLYIGKRESALDLGSRQMMPCFAVYMVLGGG